MRALDIIRIGPADKFPPDWRGELDLNPDDVDEVDGDPDVALLLGFDPEEVDFEDGEDDIYSLLDGYDPNQPRDPEGTETGGQFASGASATNVAEAQAQSKGRSKDEWLKQVGIDRHYRLVALSDYPIDRMVLESDKGLDWEYNKEYLVYGKSSMPNAFADIDDFKKRYADAPIKHLTVDEWKKMEYLGFNPNEPPSLREVIGQHSHRRDVARLANLIRHGGVPPAIVLTRGNRVRLLAGNTRLSTAAAMGYNLPVKLINVTNEVPPKTKIGDYDPNQKRDPKGTATGGQFTAGAASQSIRTAQERASGRDADDIAMEAARLAKPSKPTKRMFRYSGVGRDPETGESLRELHRAHPNFVDEKSHKELDAYVGNYTALNGMIRNGERLFESYERMDAGLQELMKPLPVDMKTYRVVSTEPITSLLREDKEAIDLTGLEVGDGLVFEGYTSTSRDMFNALGFHAEDDMPDVLFEITVKAGEKAIVTNPGEVEVILDKGQAYRVTGITEDRRLQSEPGRDVWWPKKYITLETVK